MNPIYLCENFNHLPQIVRLRGICPALEFSIDFASSGADIPLHVKVIPNECSLVMNSFIHSDWREEVKFADLDVRVGSPVDLVLLLTAAGARASFNDEVLDFYPWRAPISQATRIIVTGIDAALFRSGPWSDAAQELEIAPTNLLDPTVAQELTDVDLEEAAPTIVDRATLAAMLRELEEQVEAASAQLPKIRRLIGLDYGA